MVSHSRHPSLQLEKERRMRRRRKCNYVHIFHRQGPHGVALGVSFDSCPRVLSFNANTCILFFQYLTRPIFPVWSSNKDRYQCMQAKEYHQGWGTSRILVNQKVWVKFAWIFWGTVVDMFNILSRHETVEKSLINDKAKLCNSLYFLHCLFNELGYI
jgi:hypothetical protein